MAFLPLDIKPELKQMVLITKTKVIGLMLI